MFSLRKVLPFLCVGASLLCATSARAADPIGGIISYQGLLTDSAGKPVADGQQSLTFTFYEDGAATSTVITMPVVTIGGVFNTFLSVGSLTFDPAKSYELGIKVGDGAESKHPIAAVPVAMSAKTADSATNVSGIVPIANGGTGSATQNFVDLSTDQNITGAKTFSDNLAGSGSLVLQGGSAVAPASGAGSRMMWVPNLSAFRAGYVDGTQWDPANIGQYSTAVGYNTTASGLYSTAMGCYTTASGLYSTALGYDTTARGSGSTALGYGTTASNPNSTALGGGTTASGPNSTALGYGTIASSTYSTAMGYYTTASGYSSTAMGSSASTNGQRGSFVYGDKFTSDTLNASAPNQFAVRAQNIWLGKNNNVTATDGRFLETSTGAYLSNGGVWTNNSSRNLKTGFFPVDGRAVLRKVAALPMTSWQYKADPKSLHVGPMAQDFYGAFHLGGDNEHIGTVDSEGIALAAIQGLNAELHDRDTKIADLQARLEKLERQSKSAR